MTSQLSILVEVLLENRDCWFALPFVACFVNRVYCQVPEATPRPFPTYSSASSFAQCHRCFKLAESLSQIFSYFNLNIGETAFATKMRQSFRLNDFLSMNPFRYQTQLFSILQKCYAQGFALALPQLSADVIQYLFVLRT